MKRAQLRVYEELRQQLTRKHLCKNVGKWIKEIGGIASVNFRDNHGKLLIEVAARYRWRKYFENLMNEICKRSENVKMIGF